MVQLFNGSFKFYNAKDIWKWPRNTSRRIYTYSMYTLKPHMSDASWWRLIKVCGHSTVTLIWGFSPNCSHTVGSTNLYSLTVWHNFLSFHKSLTVFWICIPSVIIILLLTCNFTLPFNAHAGFFFFFCNLHLNYPSIIHERVNELFFVYLLVF